MKVLVWKSKHDDVHWRADTEELERWAFHQMFLALEDFGAYGDIEPEQLEMASRDIAKLESKLAVLKGKAEFADEEKDLTSHIRIERANLHQNELQWELYKKAKAGDHAAAKALCRARRAAEYEGFEFVEVTEPEKPK